MFGERYLAVDWGTTNRSLFLIEQEKVIHSERDRLGVTTIEAAAFEAEITDIRFRFGDLPMLLAGMVGSTIGWREVPYAVAPAGLDDLVARLCWVDARTAIVPGVSFLTSDHADVMRGEEIQLLGAVVAGLAPRDSLLCQPGTHCKWAQMRGGRIVTFSTAMTGELFSLLRNSGLLASQLGGSVKRGGTFEAGLDEGAKRDLLASLFGIRSAKLLGRRADTDAASFTSGLLIGADVAARLVVSAEDPIYVVAAPPLGELYVAAIAHLGRRAVLIDSRVAFAAGIVQLGRMIS